MKLIFAVDSMSIVRWWVDASDNNHKYFKGRTGSMRSLGKGLVVSYSRRKYDKLNRNRISAAYYLIPILLWSKYFIKAQAYTSEKNILYQDNKSTSLFEKNEYYQV